MAQEHLLGFNVLVLDSAVIDLYVYWKPGFRIKLEASLSIAVGINDSTTRHQLESTVALIEISFNDLDDLMTRTEKKTLGVCEALVERECCLRCLNSPTLRP